jgi:hypothetical protein
MCGRTIEVDRIVLHVDHKVPQSWGGGSDRVNLWAICSACNEGKQAHFASFDANLMKKIASQSSVHAQIGTFLNAYIGQWLDSDTLQAIASISEYQDDWQRRLRELRSLGFRIENRKVRHGKRVRSEYKSLRKVKLPEDASGKVRMRERARRVQSK